MQNLYLNVTKIKIFYLNNKIGIFVSIIHHTRLEVYFILSFLIFLSSSFSFLLDDQTLRRHWGLFHYSWRWFEYLLESQWKRWAIFNINVQTLTWKEIENFFYFVIIRLLFLNDNFYSRRVWSKRLFYFLEYTTYASLMGTITEPSLVLTMFVLNDSGIMIYNGSGAELADHPRSAGAGLEPMLNELPSPEKGLLGMGLELHLKNARPKLS